VIPLLLALLIGRRFPSSYYLIKSSLSCSQSDSLLLSTEFLLRWGFFFRKTSSDFLALISLLGEGDPYVEVLPVFWGACSIFLLRASPLFSHSVQDDRSTSGSHRPSRFPPLLRRSVAHVPDPLSIGLLSDCIESYEQNAFPWSLDDHRTPRGRVSPRLPLALSFFAPYEPSLVTLPRIPVKRSLVTSGSHW